MNAYTPVGQMATLLAFESRIASEQVVINSVDLLVTQKPDVRFVLCGYTGELLIVIDIFRERPFRLFCVIN